MWKTRDALRVNVVGALALTAILFSSVAESPVADAAQQGDLDRVRVLLVEGADVNAAQGDGMSALHWAGLGGQTEMVQVLLYAGANTEAITRLGAYTPLHLAARNGHGDVVRALLEGGADATAVATTGVTPLHFAAAAGSVEGTRALVEHGADVDAVEAAKGQTPLMFAAAAGRVEVVNELLALGTDYGLATKVVDYRERSRADGQERRRRQELMTALQKAGGDAGAEAPRTDPPATQSQIRDPNRTFAEDRRGPVAGQRAAQARAREAAASEDEEEEGEEEASEDEATEEADASAAEEPDEPGEEAQRAAAASSETPLGYNDLVGTQGGLTALHYAVRDGHVAVVTALLDAGADVNERTGGDQSTPLVIAAVNGRYDLGMSLLERGADPNLVSDDGAGPLYAAIANRWAPKALYPQPTAFKQQETSYLEFMEALLAAGADVNARLDTHIWYSSFNFDLLGVNFRGATPFWRAAYALDVPAMEMLVAWGADAHMPTRKPPTRRFRQSDDDDEETDPSGLPPVEVNGPGIPPIVAAAGVGYGRARAGNSHRHAPDSWLAAAKYLIEVIGADPNARDHDGFSALHYAAARGDNELIEYLVSKGADPLVVARTGQTTVDMANGPIQRVQPFPETIALLESMGAKNNNRCLSC